jgi:hypothetical protein
MEWKVVLSQPPRAIANDLASVGDAPASELAVRIGTEEPPQ